MSILSTTLLLSSALALGGETIRPPAPQDSGKDGGWQLVNGIAMQAGNRVVTMEELDDARRHEMESREVTNAEERDILTWSLIELMAKAHLEPQAGVDLGFDPEMISQHVRFTIKEDRRQAGAIAFSEELASTGKSIAAYEESSERDQYRDLWQRTILGFPSLPGERPTQDRFVRPGELRGIYRLFKHQLNPATVQMQVILSPVAAWGGVEPALEGFEAIRGRALAGEDFGLLEREFNAEGREDLGMTQFMPATQIQLPEVRAFAMRAGEGEVGPILNLESKGKRYLMLPKMVRREEAVGGAFGEAGVQRSLRQRLDNGRDNNILTTERARLLGRYYSWVHPALAHLKASAEAARAAQGGRRP